MYFFHRIFPGQTVKINVSFDDDNLDFYKLHRGIVRIDGWQETCPLRTTLVVKKPNEQEIIDRLMRHPNVQFVNGQRTDHGVEAQKPITDSYKGS